MYFPLRYRRERVLRLCPVRSHWQGFQYRRVCRAPDVRRSQTDENGRPVSRTAHPHLSVHGICDRKDSAYQWAIQPDPWGSFRPPELHPYGTGLRLYARVRQVPPRDKCYPFRCSPTSRKQRQFRYRSFPGRVPYQDAPLHPRGSEKLYNRDAPDHAPDSERRGVPLWTSRLSAVSGRWKARSGSPNCHSPYRRK